MHRHTVYLIMAHNLYYLIIIINELFQLISIPFDYIDYVSEVVVRNII